MKSFLHRFYGFKHTIIWETLSLGEKILWFSRGTFRNSLEFKRTILILSEKPLSLNSFLELSENRWKKPGWTVTYRKQADLKIPPCTKKVSKTMRYGILIITANTTKIQPPQICKNTHWLWMTAGIFCAVSGILVMALPVPIIGNNFAEFYREQAKLNRRIKRDKLLERRAEKERALAGRLKRNLYLQQNCSSYWIWFPQFELQFFLPNVSYGQGLYLKNPVMASQFVFHFVGRCQLLESCEGKQILSESLPFCPGWQRWPLSTRPQPGPQFLPTPAPHTGPHLPERSKQ